MNDEKECTKCGEELPATVEFFYRNSQSHNDTGLHHWCKACCGEYSRGKRQKARILKRLKFERYQIYTPFIIL